VLAIGKHSQSVRIRYYLAKGDALLRIPQRLHLDIIAGKRSLPEFASSEQRILEVVARQLTRSTYAVSARGLIYRFDERGFREQVDIDDLLSDVLEPVSEGKLVHLDRARRTRRAREKRTWRPSQSQIQEVKHDTIRSAGTTRPLPMFRPRS
jgi:hypothetical protein